MPYRIVVAKELSELFGVLSHPIRIRIVEELGGGEQDVKALVDIVNISQSGVSQHLALLRAHRVVIERKEGRNVYYRLRDDSLANWVLQGLQFTGPDQREAKEFHSAVKKAKNTWSHQATMRRTDAQAN